MKTSLLTIALFATLLFWSSCKEKSTEPVDEPCVDNIIKLDLGKDTVDYVNGRTSRVNLPQFGNNQRVDIKSIKVDSLQKLTGFIFNYDTLSFGFQQGVVCFDQKQVELYIDTLCATCEYSLVRPEITKAKREEQIRKFLNSIDWDNNSVLLTAEIRGDFVSYNEYHQFKIEAQLNTCKNIVHFHRTTIYPQGIGGATAFATLFTFTKIPKMPQDIKVIVTEERI